VTVILVMFGSLVEPEIARRLATYRTLEILVGVGVACAVDSILAEPGIIAQGAAAKPGVWASPIDRELLVVAVSGGVAIAMIPIIWETPQLPGLGQTPITAFVII
jgi:Na+-transporting methylmalonyl-CoA/oxaloacetate decarboxylase beta subunit